MKKHIINISMALSLLCGTIIWGGQVYAGELSNFEILGFNDAMTYFAFAEYGIQSNAQPFASINIVNVGQNEFAPDGRTQNIFPPTVAVDESGTGALYSLLLNFGTVLKKYRIDPLNKGRLIYILLDGDDPGDEFAFTDYKTNFVYSVHLRQTIQGIGSSADGAFSIAVDVLQNNSMTSKIVGNSSYYREGIALYKIRSIYSSIDSTSLVFVIEKLSFDTQGESSIRYMVETLSLR